MGPEVNTREENIRVQPGPPYHFLKVQFVRQRQHSKRLIWTHPHSGISLGANQDFCTEHQRA